MKSIIRCSFLAMLILLFVADVSMAENPVAVEADFGPVTEYQSIGVTGGPISVTAGGIGDGETEHEFSAPIDVALLDNDFDVPANTAIFKVKVSASNNAGNYGSSNIYYIKIGDAETLNAPGPSQSAGLPDVGTYAADTSLTTFNTDGDLITSTEVPGADLILDDDMRLHAYLIINDGKIMRGNVNDSLTILFTFPDL